MPTIAIDPEGYAAASALIGARLAGEVSAVYSELKHGLFATEAMAGHDSAGRSWGHGYDLAAQTVAEAVTALQRACVSLGRMLGRTGFNHSLAEAHSVLAHPSDARESTDNSIAPEVSSSPGDFVSAAGGSGDYPSGWSLVQSLVGFDWPDGQPARLREAASAWKTAGRTLDSWRSLVDEALTSIAMQDSPEVRDAGVVCRAFRAHVDAVATVCAETGAACADFAEVIETVHAKCVGLLSDLASDVARAQLFALLFAGETEGGSEDLALEYDASRVFAVATKIESHLAGFAEEVAEVVSVQSGTGTDAAAATQALAPILGAKLTTANTVIHAGGPAAVIRNDEVLATRRLSTAAKINWAGLEDAERRGGHTMDRHVGKSDAYLIHRGRPGPRGKRRASTFTDLASAQRATAENIAYNTEKIHDWQSSGDDEDLPISTSTGSADGRIYMRSTGTFTDATGVRSVLRKGKDGYFVVTSYPIP